MDTDRDDYEESIEFATKQLIEAICNNPATCIPVAHQIWKDALLVVRSLFGEPDDNGFCQPVNAIEEHHTMWDVFCLSTGKLDKKLTTRTLIARDAIQTARDLGHMIPFDPIVLSNLLMLLSRIRDCSSISREDLYRPVEKLAEETDRVYRVRRFAREKAATPDAKSDSVDAAEESLCGTSPDRLGIRIANDAARLIAVGGREIRISDADWNLCRAILDSGEAGITTLRAREIAGSDTAMRQSVQRIKAALTSTDMVIPNARKTGNRYRFQRDENRNVT